MAHPVIRASIFSVLLAVGLATTGCSLTKHVETRHYDKRADAPERGDLAFVLPKLIPGDAANITVYIKTDSANDKMYDWTSPSGALPQSCQREKRGPAPFDKGQWPDQVWDSDGFNCAGKHVRARNEHFYAW